MTPPSGRDLEEANLCDHEADIHFQSHHEGSPDKLLSRESEQLSRVMNGDHGCSQLP